MGVAVPGASVTISDGGGTVASGTTDGTGQFVANPAAGTYTVTVGAVGAYAGWTMSIAHTCNQTTTINLSKADGTPCGGVIQEINFTVGGCTGGLPGQPVTITGPSGFSVSGTTDSTGTFAFHPPVVPGSYTGSVTPTGPGFVAGSTTFPVTSGTLTFGVSLTPASGYYCTCVCNWPWPENVSLTLGAWSGTVHHSGSTWIGCATMTLPVSSCTTGTYPCSTAGVAFPCALASTGASVCYDFDDPCDFDRHFTAASTTTAARATISFTDCATANPKIVIQIQPSSCTAGGFPNVIVSGSCIGDDPSPAIGTVSGGGATVTVPAGAQCETLDIEISQAVAACNCLSGAAGSTLTGAITA